MGHYKNDLFLRTLGGETPTRPPVWIMRQAGRYLPDFMKLSAKYDFFTRCQTPELVAEITLMPVDQLGVDAAILFSDILVVPQAMRIQVQMKPGSGPRIPNPIRSASAVEKLPIPDVAESLSYVMDAIELTKDALDNRVPLIGFAGSPWTLLCYVVEGKGSKTFDVAKGFCFSQPEAAHVLLQKITDTTIRYLREQVRAGADVVQIFDSWGGLLSPGDYRQFSWSYIDPIIEALKDEVPVIVFGKGCWFAYGEMADSNATAIGLDWTVSPELGRALTRNRKVIQGNYDPARLLSPIPKIKKDVGEMIDRFGTDRYIANLGHGILPKVPVDHARAFVDAVKEYPNRR